MSELMQQALEALEMVTVDAKTTPNAYEAQRQAITALRAAIERAHDWDEVEALRASLREHMAEIQRLRAAIKQVQDPETELETYKRLYELRGKALERPCSNCGHQPAKIKATAQTDSAQSGLAEKVPAKGTLLEQTLRRVWDETPHAALMDAIIGGTGVMLGDKRIDPASIYKQPDQKPVAWFTVDEINEWAARYLEKHPDQETRQWQGLTGEEVAELTLEHAGYPVRLTGAIEAKLKEKNT